MESTRNERDAEGLAPSPIVEALAPDGAPVASTVAEADRLASQPDAEALGRHAETPAGIPWPGWQAVLRRTALEMLTDRVALVAAGCAFYATLALFPAMSMLISVYGLVFDPETVLPQLAVLRDLLPPAAFQLIAERVQLLVAKPPGALAVSLLISTAVTLWSSAAGTKSIIAALNLAYEERERRSFLRVPGDRLHHHRLRHRRHVLGLAFMVALPPALEFFGLASHQRLLIRISSLVLLVGAVMVGLSLLYRYGPSRRIAALELGDAGLQPGDADLADGVVAVLVLRRDLRDLRRHLWPARDRGGRDDVVLRHSIRRAAGC